MLYQKVRIDALNKKRFRAYFAACEIATIWYVVDKPNKDYGFESQYKLRSATYSPMEEKFSRVEQSEIYPLFDAYGDMIALSIEFTHKIDDEEIVFFETYTSDKKYSWKKTKGGGRSMKIIWSQLERSPGRISTDLNLFGRIKPQT